MVSPFRAPSASGAIFQSNLRMLVHLSPFNSVQCHSVHRTPRARIQLCQPNAARLNGMSEKSLHHAVTHTQRAVLLSIQGVDTYSVRCVSAHFPATRRAVRNVELDSRARPDDEALYEAHRFIEVVVRAAAVRIQRPWSKAGVPWTDFGERSLRYRRKLCA